MNDNESVTDNDEEESFEVMTPPESDSNTHDNKDKNSSDQAEITTKDAPSKFFHHDYITDELMDDLEFASRSCGTLTSTAASVHHAIEEKLVILKAHQSDWSGPTLSPLQELDMANDCKEIFKTLKDQIVGVGMDLDDDRFGDDKWANMGALALKKLLHKMKINSDDVKELEKLQPKPKPTSNRGWDAGSEAASSWPELPMEAPDSKEVPEWLWGGQEQK